MCNAKIEHIEDKKPDITILATNTTLNSKINELIDETTYITIGFNAKINEVKGRITSITNLTTATAVTDAENEKPNISNLVEKNSPADTQYSGNNHCVFP